MKLAILQSIPTHPRHPVQTDTFAKFQHLCGMIEQQSFLAAHAACHATMNGIPRTLAVDTDISDETDVLHALDTAFQTDPFDALVLPGLTDPSIQHAVSTRCQREQDTHAFKIIFDAPRDTPVAELVRRQRVLPRFATLCWPYISTVTPGRRSPEWLPASCVAAPLLLKTAPHLRGVHEPASLSADDAATLDEAGVLVLRQKIVARRPVIGLMTPPSRDATPSTHAFADVEVPPGLFVPDTSAPECDEAAFERELLAALETRCAEVIHTHPKNDANLWAALARTVTAELIHARDKGYIRKYHVRCDAETASWGTPETPVVEILIDFPKRVREVKFNVSTRTTISP